MVTWVVKRHGMNAANQSCQQVKVLGTVVATTMGQAIDEAVKNWSCYNGQFFAVQTLDECPLWQINEAYTQDTLNEVP